MTFRAAARRSHPGAVFSVRGHRSHWRTTGTCRGLIHMETPPTSDSVLAAVRCLMTPSAALSLARCAALACCAALPSTSAACHEYRRKVGYAVRLSGPECFRLKTMRKLPITGTLASAGQPSFRALCGGAWSWLPYATQRVRGQSEHDSKVCQGFAPGPSLGAEAPAPKPDTSMRWPGAAPPRCSAAHALAPGGLTIKSFNGVTTPTPAKAVH